MEYELKRIEDDWSEQPVYEVWTDNELRGTVRGHHPTFERGPANRRWVTKRWTSKKRYWRAALPGKTPNGRYEINYETRKLAVEALLNA